MVELTEFLVKSLVKNPDSVSVKQTSSSLDSITITVLVSKDEIGAVIGRNGNVARAIRTIVRASSFMNDAPKVNIEIDSF